MACCATATIILAGCGSSSTDSARTAAKGEISLYTSQPESDAQKLIAAFNKKYPDVKIKLFRSGTEEVVSKVMAEKKMGKIQADLLLVSDAATFEQLKKQDVMSSASTKTIGLAIFNLQQAGDYSLAAAVSAVIIFFVAAVFAVQKLIRSWHAERSERLS